MISRIEICGYDSKEILYWVWWETTHENVHLQVV